MAISKNLQANIDDSDPTNYPNGQVKDDDGTNNGFPLIQVTVSDIFETFDKLIRMAAITFNDEFDNEGNGYQFVDAIIALAGKNDYILPITTSGDILQIPTATNILQLNERLICQAQADLGDETQIKGTGAALLNITRTRVWKSGDYLLLIRTNTGILVVGLITSDNVNLIVSENAYLKAAANADEDTGTSTTKATTPASNKYIFTKRVTDPTAAIPFLASHTHPGLLSAADKTAIDGFASPVKNVGWFSGVDAGGGTVGATAPRSGDIVSAVITNVGGAGDFTIYLVTLANAMTGTNYFIRYSVASEGTIAPTDSSIGTPVFRPLTDTTFSFSIIQFGLGGVQNLKIHCEAVQIS